MQWTKSSYNASCCSWEQKDQGSETDWTALARLWIKRPKNAGIRSVIRLLTVIMILELFDHLIITSAERKKSHYWSSVTKISELTSAGFFLMEIWNINGSNVPTYSILYLNKLATILYFRIISYSSSRRHKTKIAYVWTHKFGIEDLTNKRSCNNFRSERAQK